MDRYLLTAGGLIAAGLSGLPARAEMPQPVDQTVLNRLSVSDPSAAFLSAFEAGDELTEAEFTAARGVGARVAAGVSFTRYPRADLDGPGDWAEHMPPREGGPQAQSCISCHAAPYANGAGGLALNVAIDPMMSGDPALYLERNTLPLFGLGAVQRIAEEMTAELQSAKAALGAGVCEAGAPDSVALRAKGVDFGSLTAEPSRTDAGCTAVFDMSAVDGVDDDLVIRMFGWKGNQATIRAFTRGAAHNELGMQADELVGDVDGDHDGVTGELSVGDVTAMTVYMAALERPTSLIELDSLGISELDPALKETILAGEARFAEVGCASCHVPEMTIDDPVFSEPSASPAFAEATMPGGMAAADVGLSPATAIRFDLTRDQPNNLVLATADGAAEELTPLGVYPRNAEGKAIVTWYSDFRRHDMGPGLADPIDAYGVGASVWPTRSLAGVGTTGPWLHNGHATTLDEAIRAHGGEAADSRDAYVGLSDAEQEEIVAFLGNLVFVDLDPESETD